MTGGLRGLMRRSLSGSRPRPPRPAAPPQVCGRRIYSSSGTGAPPTGGGVLPFTVSGSEAGGCRDGHGACPRGVRRVCGEARWCAGLLDVFTSRIIPSVTPAAHPRPLVVVSVIILLLILSPTADADLGVYADSEDQHLTIRITPLPTDSGFPHALYRHIQLRCLIDTEPAIDTGECGWRFNHGQHFLENSSKYTLYQRPARGTVHTVTMVLTINGVTEEELGFYSCEGKNSAGLSRSSTVALDLIDEDTVGIREAIFPDPSMTTEMTDNGVNSRSVDDTATDVTTQSLDVTSHEYPTSSSTRQHSQSLVGSSHIVCLLVGMCVMLLIEYLTLE